MLMGTGGRERGERLFAKFDLDAGLRNQSTEFQKQVDSIDDERFRAESDEALRDEVRKATLLVPLVLDDAGMTMVDEEVQIDVSGDPMRMAFHSGRKVLIPGIRLRVSVPFTGDVELWRCRPNPWSEVFTRGELRAGNGGRGGVLELTFEQPTDQPVEAFKTMLDQALVEIRQAIDRQKDQIQRYQSSVDPQIDAAIASRRARLGKRGGLASIMGIKPAAPQPATPPAAAPTIAKRSPALPSQGWDVFISHASGDKEDFVRPLAQALVARGFLVWFDELTLKLGDSLRRSIDTGLASSRYGVVILSPAFFSKEWPQKELDGLVARESGGHKVILPVLHNLTIAELRQQSPILADKLASSSSKGVDAVADEIATVLRP